MSPLFTKLRYKLGTRVCVIGAPSGFSAEVARLPKSIERAAALRGRFDLVHAFFTRKAQLVSSAPKLRAAIEDGGILWISYPKGKALGTDLNRDIIHDLMPAYGLDAIAQVAVDDVWSALRCKLLQAAPRA
jgi:hypothetical protein